MCNFETLLLCDKKILATKTQRHNPSTDGHKGTFNQYA